MLSQVQELAEIYDVLWQSRVTAYSWWSATALLWYTLFLSFPEEVIHIWRSKWTIPKILYLFVRYWSLLIITLSALTYSRIQKSHSFCVAYTWFSVTIGGIMILGFAVEIILALRLYALYSGSKRVLWFLISSNVAHFIIQVYVLIHVGISNAKTVYLAPLGLPLLGCLATPNLHLTLASWITAISLSIIYFSMMLRKFLQSVFDARKDGIRLSIPPLMKAFIRDGTIYFLMVVVMLIVGALDSTLASGPLLSIYLPWGVVVFVIAASFLILNLREAALLDDVHDLSDTFFRGLEVPLVYDQSRHEETRTRPVAELP